MKILCPTDFSPRARAAVEVAVGLAQRTGGNVELLHVVPPRAADIVALGAEAAGREDKIRSDAHARLAAECREVPGGGASLSSWVEDGEVESAVLHRARSIEADLIVMGANGRAGLERFVLGSAAERTVRRADRPVMVVPPGAKLAARVPNGSGRLRLVVALDGRSGSAGALEFTRALRRAVACDVTFLRLYWPLEEYQRLGLTGPRDLWRPDPDIVENLTRALATEVGVLPGAGQTSFVTESTWGSPADAILAFARGRDCDLLVMGAESRHGLARIAHTSVASRVAHEASGVPVVFVPAPARGAEPAEIPGIFTVLAPTDLSTTGNRAVGFAYAMLGAHGGVVELCHVHERALPSPAFVYDRPEGKLGEAERARIIAELRGNVPADAERLGITTHVTLIDGGRAAQAVLQAAERLSVDAIVLGSHGRSGASRALLGSVSEEVVRHAHRPVLVVPGSKEAS
jgi:nucleotide-binding universal stress UspA family protein